MARKFINGIMGDSLEIIYEEVHDEVEKKYNYQKELLDYLRELMYYKFKEGDIMLWFELIKYENGKYIYYFYPDIDKTAYGIISISESGEREIIQQSNVDVKQYYMGHALWGIPVGEKNGTVAWC